MKTIEESWKDKNNWWNKLSTLTSEDLDSLPNEYIRKFGSYIIRTQENQQEAKQEINKDFSIYSQVKDLKEIKTAEQLEKEEAARQKYLKADTSYQYELEGYLKRQPRLDLSKVNYNRE